MSDDFARRVAGIGALREPVRRELYRYVAAQPEPVSREQAAHAVDVPLHTVKFHLDRLVEDGLLEVEFRRLSGRSGPGAGRPAKLYRRVAGEIAVSLPERRYDLAGQILAAGVERAARDGVPVETAVADAAAEAGRRAGETAAGTGPGATGEEPGGRGPALERLAATLVPYGYEPRRREDELVLANCPFDALVREHTDLVCGMNASFLGGVVTGLGCAGLEACLDPEPGLCCVKARRASSPSPVPD